MSESEIRTTCPYCGVGCGVLVNRTEAPAISPLCKGGNGFTVRGDPGHSAGLGQLCSSGMPLELVAPPHSPLCKRGAGGDSTADTQNEPAAKSPQSHFPKGGDTFTVRGDPDHPANFGRLCSKGTALAETLSLDDRLLHPEINDERVSWAAALDTVAQRFRQVIDEHGPDAVAFYVSGQLLTEDYYVANKLMKGFIGSANIDTNSRLCMSSAVAGHKRAFGSDTVPACYEDLEIADLVTLVGANAAWAHPVAYQRIAAAKQARPEMKVAVIDPRRTATCDIADLHLAIAPGTDAWLFHGLLNHLRREGAVDWSYLERHVEGFGAALDAVRELDIPTVAMMCGLGEPDVAEFYRQFSLTARSVTLFSQGINQSSSGVDKVNAILNVHLATGRVGLPGASPFSITGQPNAMGGREVGGLANQLAAHMDFTPEAVDRVARFWNAPGIARQPGLKAVDLFEAVRAGRIKALWVMATNPAVSLPDADRVVEAMKRCEFLVVSDNTARTDTARLAHVRLPAAAWGEKNGTVTNSERRISRQRNFLPLPGEARPDWWIVSEVARRMGHGEAFDYAGPADIFREHAMLSAFENEGRRDFDLGGLADADYDTLPPVQWPVPTAGPGTARMFGDGRYFRDGGQGRLVAAPPRAPATPATPDKPLLLNTGRIRDQWHTMTRTGKTAKLLAHIDEPYVEMHPDDIRRARLDPGALARVTGVCGSAILRVTESVEQRPGSVFAPIHWNDEFSAKARVDALIPAVTDPISGQPEFKQAPVSVEPYAAGWYGFVLARGRMDCGASEYWTRVRGKACWRHELAGPEPECPWPTWLQARHGRHADWIVMRDGARNRHRLALLQGGRIEAVAFFDRDFASLPPRHWLEGLFERDRLDAEERCALLLGRPSQAVPDSGAIVCACFGVGENDIRTAIVTGAGSVEALGARLKAGTNCGSCIPELRKRLAAA